MFLALCIFNCEKLLPSSKIIRKMSLILENKEYMASLKEKLLEIKAINNVITSSA